MDAAEDIDLEDFAAVTTLRRYQRRAVEELVVGLESAGSRVCLVAPPGSGKTQCALHVAASVARPLEVFVPTTALVQQWEAQIREGLLPILGHGRFPARVNTYAAKRTPPSGALVVLDEAHHLGAAWGRHLEEQLDDSHRVLGLTGTPLVDDGRAAFARFVNLVGAEPVVIETPPLVRDGHLSPYIDLVWPVVVDAEDAPELAAAHEALLALELAYRAALRRFIETSLEEDLEQLTEARFARNEGHLVALCRHAVEAGLDLPLDLPLDPEFFEPPTLRDRAELLLASEEEVAGQLREHGFDIRDGKVRGQRDIASKSLGSARARLRGLIDVLTAEHESRGAELRALVLTDRDKESDRLSARAILKTLVDHPLLGGLDPVLVTGSAFWIDDEVWPHVQAEGSVDVLPWTHVGDTDGHYELDISQWPTADRVRLATELLISGATRCLVGTHHLLGEGWDCPPVNCVVDLTGIVRSITTNQIRGRGLRLDPADPGKIASLWEILPVAPGLADGGRLLERLQERHRHTLGIDQRGRVRVGVGRIDAQLEGAVSAVAMDAPALRERMLERLRDLPGVRKAWNRGRDYLDRHQWTVDLRARSFATASRGTSSSRSVARSPAPRATALVALRARSTRFPWGRWSALAAASAVSVVLSPLGVLLPLVGMGMAAAHWGLTRRRRARASERVVWEVLLRSLAMVHGTEGELIVGETEVRLAGAPDASALFARSLAELLGPITYPRYLLVPLRSGRPTLAVPTALGRNRADAGGFARVWSERIEPVEAVYARTGEGRVRLAELWRSAPRPSVELVETWE